MNQIASIYYMATSMLLLVIMDMAKLQGVAVWLVGGIALACAVMGLIYTIKANRKG